MWDATVSTMSVVWSQNKKTKAGEGFYLKLFEAITSKAKFIISCSLPPDITS